MGVSHARGVEEEVKQMERKFESELAGQVARRHRNPIKGRVKILFMTVVSCAVMVAAAAAVLSIGASAAEGTPTTFEGLAFTEEDYLISGVDGAEYASTIGLEDDFLVKRTSELKWTTFATPGNSPADYTKVAYTVNVKLRDTSSFTDGVAGMFISDVTIDGFGIIDPVMVSASISVNGVALTTPDQLDPAILNPLDFTEYLTWTYSAGVLSAQVELPGYLYADGDMVSIFVMFKTHQTGLMIMGSEFGFPDYNPAYPVVETVA